jgi:hypothetical protein
MKTIAMYSIVLILSLSLLNSCFVTYGNDTYGNITVTVKDTCTVKANNVQLYFEGDSLYFDYEKIGVVEAIGDQSASDEELLNYLKYYAWNYCADAVINIKGGWRERQTGFYGQYLLGEDERDYPKNYDAYSFHGVAVRTINDTLFDKVADTAFIGYVNKDNEKQDRSHNLEFIFSILIAFIGIIGVIVKNQGK